MLNLLTSLDVVKAAFVKMEDKAALENDGEYGFAGVLMRFQEFQESKNKYFGFSATVYGTGGVNRYFVTKDGNMRFSAYHAAWPKEETVEKAKKLGFEVC